MLCFCDVGCAYDGIDQFYSTKILYPRIWQPIGEERAEKLKLRADALEKQMLYREAYWENVRNVLSGKAELILDTAVIAIPELEEIKD